jgi:hypothetical protein
VSEAPDAVVPSVGWRVWDVVELDGELRLCSLSFWTIWLPHRETTAVCRRALVDLHRSGFVDHPAPHPRCTCGIYATLTAGQVLAYARPFPRRADAVHRVVGRVRLWGDVVECEGGWRGEHAYPSALFVPTGRAHGWRRGRIQAPALPVEHVAIGLADYGVPVEILDCVTESELVTALEPRDPA